MYTHNHPLRYRHLQTALIIEETLNQIFQIHSNHHNYLRCREDFPHTFSWHERKKVMNGAYPQEFLYNHILENDQ